MKTHSPYSILLAMTLALGCGTTALAESPFNNIVANGSFTRASGGRPEAWQLLAGDTGKTAATLSLDQGRKGGRALKLEYPVNPALLNTSDPLAAPPVGFEQQGIALNVSDGYTLTFWMRGENIASRSVKVALIDTSEREYSIINERLYATPEWQRYEFNFQWWLNKAPDTARLRFTLEEFGTVWVSDVNIICTSPASPRYNPRLPRTAGRNLLPNGSFDLGRDGWTSMGTKTGWGGDVSGLYGEVSSEAPFAGANCFKVEVGPGKSPVTYYDCWPTDRVVQNILLTANQGWIDVEAGQTYTFSAYMKASRPGVGGRLLIRHGGAPERVGIKQDRKDVMLSEKWERYSMTVKAEASQMCVAVGPDITATPDTLATVWLDAVQLEAGSEPTAPAPSEPLEVGIEVPARGHVFTPEEPATLQVTALNTASEAAVVNLRASVSDYFGRIVARPELRINVPAGSNVRRSWSLGKLDRGYYNVTVTRTVGAEEREREIRLAVLPPYPWKESIFGINHAPADASFGAVLQRAGILWARDWSINWGWLEPEQGKLSFATSDVQLNRLKQEGYNIICLLPPLPSADWSSSAPDSVKPELWNRMAYAPKDTGLLLDFMRKAVEHSRDRVSYWEFLNEPVWTGFCLPQRDFSKPGSEYTPADYVKLLQQAYPVIKAADPKGKVIGGFAAQPWHHSREFMTLGGLKSVDIFNIHNYGTYRAPERFISEMETLLSLMDQNGGRKPIWLTEYSYYGMDEMPWEPWSPPSGSWSANILLRDERQSADWSIRYNFIMLAHGVEKIVYHSGGDGDPNDGQHFMECMMVAEDGLPRKLYAAQATMAEIIGPDCRFSRPWAIAKTVGGHSTSGIHGYAFQCGRRAVMPVWATEAAAKENSWRIAFPKGVQALDIVGNPLTGENIRLGPSPVYLVSDTLPADRLADACKIAAP